MKVNFFSFSSLYDNQTAYQLALGNLDVNSKSQVDNFDPDSWQVIYVEFQWNSTRISSCMQLGHIMLQMFEVFFWMGSCMGASIQCNSK